MSVLSSGQEEYTDYSCSTPMERLAQDVETVLRKWHLAHSDRHVSFAQPPMDRSHSDMGSESSPAKNSKRKTLKNKSRSLILDLGSREETNHMLSAPAKSLPTIRKRSSQQEQQVGGVQLIRQEQIEWTLALVDGRKVTLPLNLDLWDGPSDHGTTSCNSDEPGLPLSVRRLPLTKMPDDLFDNLATVFGIGQHITLSLKKGQDDENAAVVMRTLGASVLRRHNDHLAPWVVSSSLSGMLQTALQCALSTIQCNLPAFGIWGSYAPATMTTGPSKTSKAAANAKSPFRKQASLLPDWIQDCAGPLPTGRRPMFRSTDHLNRTYIPPIVKSSMLQCGPQFWISVMPFNDSSSGRLTVWGELLIRHSSTPTVVLCGAKHLYSWRKPQTKLPRTSMLLRSRPIQEWRQPIMMESAESESEYDGEESNLESYQIQCRNHVMSLFERFSGASASKPLWGPVDDPVKAVNVIVTWDPKPSSNSGDKKSSSSGGLLTMPLKIRSEQGMTKADIMEMEESIERSILDPLNPSAFEISTVFDTNTSLINLAASQRLLLAAMIRTSVLPSNTMIYQLSDEFEMDSFSNPEIDNATENLLNRAGVGSVTRQLVNAIDWTTLSDEMIQGWEAERVVQKVMDGTSSHGFPSPPDQVFVDPEGSAPTGLFASFPKSAPPGRLLSILFVQMSRLRSPASMALVWSYFVMDLQKRFYSRTSLPNMPYVPGIDPAPSMVTEKHCFSMSALRSKVENTAYVHCSEPQPDDMHCLIGQKLQVFNIAIESLVATDMYDATKMDRSFEHDQEAVMNDTVVFDNLPARQHDFLDTSMRDFHDAMSVGSHAMTVERYMLDRPDENNANEIRREGARCPVFGETLVMSGDQVYAPYLRRPYPWTDDVLLERKSMLSKTAQSATVQERLDVAHRFVKAKLVSDMQAFQAANPGAVFQDFINWYGNPANALDGFDDGSDGDDTSVSIRTSTRSFWAEIWEGAIPVPAIDQPALFDLTSTVEIVLDHLETVHPASLLNQVMAVNLSVSYFTMMAAAGQATRIPSMSGSLLVLREKIDYALDLLARDATNGTSAATPTSPELFPRHVSLQSIRACEDACNAISDTESLVARVTSLLHKFPGQYNFIEHILGNRNGDIIPMKNRDGRTSVLDIIQRQQQNSGTLPNPSRRSYVLRNTDEQRPCQMCVRYGEDGSFQDTRDGGLLIAITKTLNKTAQKIEI